MRGYLLLLGVPVRDHKQWRLWEPVSRLETHQHDIYDVRYKIQQNITESYKIYTPEHLAMFPHAEQARTTRDDISFISPVILHMITRL